MDNLRKGSKNEYSHTENSLEAINTGCMQRMADSLERMEKPYLNLIRNLEYARNRMEELNESLEKLKRSNNSLRGHITRLKNKYQ